MAGDVIGIDDVKARQPNCVEPLGSRKKRRA
jgi:hypothetical protein